MNIKLYSLVSVEALRFKYIRDTHVMTSLQKTPSAKPRASARLHLRQKVQKDGVGSLVLDERAPRSEMRRGPLLGSKAAEIALPREKMSREVIDADRFFQIDLLLDRGRQELELQVTKLPRFSIRYSIRYSEL